MVHHRRSTYSACPSQRGHRATSSSGSLFDLFGSQSLDQERLNPEFPVPLFILLQGQRSSDVLVGPEFRLRLVMQVAFGGNVGEQVGHIRELGCFGTDRAEQRYLPARRSRVVERDWR